MIYREIGKTGMKASVVGFGGMRFFARSEDIAVATVRRCLELGINFFETGSYGGGKSEIMLGKALKDQCPREDVILANKCHISSFPSADEVRAQLETSLERVQVDYFDVYSFWGTNTPEFFAHVMKPGGPLEGIQRAREEGLVRAIGITTHARAEWILQFAEEYPWDCITLKEHFLYSRQQEVIPKLGEKHIGVVVMTPLAGGVICTPGPDVTAELEVEGMTAPVLGLRYLTSNPHVTSAISGMSLPEEVDENVKAGEIDGPLSDVEKRLVEFIRDKTTALGDHFCTSCGYCQPCQQEVNIPGIFRLWNIMRGYGSEGYSKLEYMKLREERSWADFPGKSAEHCIECGECEAKCPENILIVEDLKRAHEDLVQK